MLTTYPLRVAATLASLALLTLSLVACSSTVPTADPVVLGATATASASIPIPSWPVAGNSLRASLPTDAPPEVRNLFPLIDCGAEMVIDRNSPSAEATPDWTPTTSNANRQATDCFVSAWGNGKVAQMAKAEITSEGDVMYVLYRLPGDGTIVVFVRDLSSDEQELNWYTTICDQLTLDQGQVVPAGCRNQRQLNPPSD